MLKKMEHLDGASAWCLSARDVPSSTALDPDGRDVTGHLRWLSVIDLRTHSIPSIPYIIPEGSNTHTHAHTRGLSARCLLKRNVCMLLLCALWLSICGCGQIARGFSASKYGMSCRVLQPGLHMQPCMLKCIHLHPLLARDSVTRTSPTQQRQLRGAPRHGGSCRACTFSPPRGFIFHSPVGFYPPTPAPPRSDVHMQKYSQRRRGRHVS